ncbi:hypothetical protein, partial [Amycolatopsis japonica]
MEQAHAVSQADREEPSGTSEPDDLVELTPADRPPVRSHNAERDAAKVLWWSAKPPEAGPLELSEEDMARLGELADGLLKRSPVAEDKPWDIRMHVTESKSWLDQYGPTWFEQMETVLTEILIDRGVPENSEMLLFGFDHLEHRTRRSGQLPVVGITVHETSAETIHDYRSAHSLDLYFQAHRDSLLKASQRKLHWRVESLAKGVKSDAGDRSRLLLDLRTTKGKLSAHVKAVTQAVNVAIQWAYPGASKAEIKAFIDKHIEFIYSISEVKKVALFVDLVDYAESGSMASSLQKFAPLKKGVNATFDRIGSDYVKLSEDGEKEIREFGDLLGQKILTRPPELPDGRISVMRYGTTGKKIQKLVRDYLTDLLREGMRSARVAESGARLSESEIKGFAFTWLWGKNSKHAIGQVHVRTHVTMGEPEDGRPPDYYRQAKNLAGTFVSSTSTQLSKREERRVVLATEGFVGRYNAATGEGPTLKIEIKGKPTNGKARENRMKAVVEEALKAVPGGEQIRRDHVRIEWNQNSALPANVDFSVRETALGEESVGGPVSDVGMFEGGGMELEGVGGVRGDEQVLGPVSETPAPMGSLEEDVARLVGVSRADWEAALGEEGVGGPVSDVGMFEGGGMELEGVGGVRGDEQVLGPVSETPAPMGSLEEDVARLVGVSRADREKSGETSEFYDLVELTPADRPPVRVVLRNRTASPDAAEVDWWSAKPPKAGPLELSGWDKARLGAMVDRLLERSPVAEGKPWDIRLHVTESNDRFARHTQAWFELLEQALKTALIDRGVPEESEMLLFGFDRIGHWENKAQGKLPSVDIIVHETSEKTIHDYRGAQSLDLVFLSRREPLLKASRRQLHWRVESFAKAVKSDAGDRSRLVLDLRTTEDRLSAHVKEVTQAVNVAVRRAYPGASKVEIKAFIDKHIEFIYRTSKKGKKVDLFVDVVNYAEVVPTTSSLWEFAQLKKGVNATFDRADPDYVKLSEDGEKEIRKFGGLLGQKMLTRPLELPDVRIVAYFRSATVYKQGEAVVRDYLTGLLGEGMRSARVAESGARLSESEIKGFAFAWLWGVDSKESAGRVSVRTHVAMGEPEDGRPP